MVGTAMADSYETYPTARALRLSVLGALHAVLAYATDFIARGDIDVLFTLSGGAICADGRSADPAVWHDWITAWRATEAWTDETAEGGTADARTGVDVQYGFRALLVFLERNYQPIDQTPMSAVRADCEAVFDETSRGPGVWDNWLEAVDAGASADISYRLM